MPRSIITLTTDFGNGSAYIAEMKGVILTLNPEANIVDITHGIAPQDVRAAAHVIDRAAFHFPEGAIHVVVVDPGVGGDREVVFVEMGERRFIAPDNGVLSLIAQRKSPANLTAVRNSAYRLRDVSTTFHGRDIMAPAAAYLSLGLEAEQLGPPVAKLKMLPANEVAVSQGKIEGSIVSFDSFGNLITDISEATCQQAGIQTPATIACGGQKVRGISKTYCSARPGNLTALFGSSGMLELAIVNGNAAEKLNLHVGQPVWVTW